MSGFNGNLVDIIVPFYNKAEYVSGFLTSFFKLDGDYFNLIIVDDGSSDNTLDIIKEIIKDNKKENIIVISQGNKGVSSARNAGLAVSQSSYVWFCDPDDLIMESANEIIPILNDSNHIDVFIFSYVIEFVFKKEVVNVKREEECFFSYDDFLLKSSKLIHDYGHPAADGTVWDKIYRRDIIGSVMFSEDLSCSEDFLFNKEVLGKVNVIASLPNYIYNYHIYGGGTLSSEFSKKSVFDRMYVERLILEYIIGLDDSIRNKAVDKFIFKSCMLLSKAGVKDSLVSKFYFSERERYGWGIKCIKNKMLTLLFFTRTYSLCRNLKVNIVEFINRG